MNKTKYLKQKGFLPFAISTIGLFLHTFFILGTLVFVLPYAIHDYLKEPLIIAFLDILVFVLLWLCFIISIPILGGAILVSAFPEIRLTDQGIECRIYKIFKKTIKWGEVQEIRDLPNNFKALVINRRGFFLFNGLYENKLYGHFVKNNKKPVLFLSSKLENGEEWLRYIKSKINKG